MGIRRICRVPGRVELTRREPGQAKCRTKRAAANLERQRLAFEAVERLFFCSHASKISLTRWQSASRWSRAGTVSESARRWLPGTEAWVGAGTHDTDWPRRKGTTASLPRLVAVDGERVNLGSPPPKITRRRRGRILPPGLGTTGKKCYGGPVPHRCPSIGHLFAMSRASIGTSCTSKGTNNACFLLTIL